MIRIRTVEPIIRRDINKDLDSISIMDRFVFHPFIPFVFFSNRKFVIHCAINIWIQFKMKYENDIRI